MKSKKHQKRALTLLEIMIVIFLITLITGVVGYNMKGSLEKGKKFRTEQAIAQLEDMFQLALSEGQCTLDDIKKDPLKVLRKLGIAKDPDKLIKDGWGAFFEIHTNTKTGEIAVQSKNMSKKSSAPVLTDEE